MLKLINKNYRMEAFVIRGVHRKEYIIIDVFLSTCFAVYVCCSEGLKGLACANTYTLLK